MNCDVIQIAIQSTGLGGTSQIIQYVYTNFRRRSFASPKRALPNQEFHTLTEAPLVRRNHAISRNIKPRYFSFSFSFLDYAVALQQTPQFC